MQTAGKYSWQVMNWKIAIKELAVSGCDYMTSFREKRKLKLVMEVLFGNRELIRKLIKGSEDIVVAGSVADLVRKMNEKKNPYDISMRKHLQKKSKLMMTGLTEVPHFSMMTNSEELLISENTVEIVSGYTNFKKSTTPRPYP